MVAWKKSTRTGRFYLIEVFDYDGILRGAHNDLHSTYCGHPEEHEREQNSITAEFQARNDQLEESRVQAEIESADYYLSLHALCLQDPATAEHKLSKLQAQLESELRQPATMDYMVEFNQYCALVKKLTTEIAFMNAALGHPIQDDDI